MANESAHELDPSSTTITARTTPPAMTAKTAPKLLTLPKEVRLLIYDQLFEPLVQRPEHFDTYVLPCEWPENDFSIVPALLGTCKQLHQEAKAHFEKHFLENVIVYFDHVGRLREFCEKIERLLEREKYERMQVCLRHQDWVEGLYKAYATDHVETPLQGYERCVKRRSGTQVRNFLEDQVDRRVDEELRNSELQFPCKIRILGSLAKQNDRRGVKVGLVLLGTPPMTRTTGSLRFLLHDRVIVDDSSYKIIVGTVRDVRLQETSAQLSRGYIHIREGNAEDKTMRSYFEFAQTEEKHLTRLKELSQPLEELLRLNRAKLSSN
ncbi:hypothetical protein B0A50_01475 [Salinomyces thailandicus]|uniref:Uncharacterized protein n=1 Tax=Salinomyces thailandicus TaxID=706561 RepID=A0A4V6WJX3_9PEZI|nr:hypothetical protein B0A50_01475 [Salinomyces thailandica]